MYDIDVILLYYVNLLLCNCLLHLYLLMTLQHYSIQIHMMYLQKYTMYIYVVLQGVLALVVFADDSSELN